MPALIWYPPSDCGRAAYDTVDCSISALPWVISRGVELRLNEEVGGDVTCWTKNGGGGVLILRA